jgi:hypothetical protein
MVKIVEFVIAFLLLIAFFNYLIFFWINRRRIWKKEDEEYNKRKKQEAIEDLRESQRLLENVNFEAYDINEQVKKGERVKQSRN